RISGPGIRPWRVRGRTPWGARAGMSTSAISPAEYEALLEELGEDTVAQMRGMAGMTDEEIAREMRELAARDEPGTVKQLVRRRALRQQRTKTNLDSVLNSIEERGFTTRL